MFGTFPGDACQKPLPAQGSRAHGSVGPRGAMGILSRCCPEGLDVRTCT